MSTGFVGALAPTSAFATEPSDDDPEVVEQAKQHYKLGLDAYKAGKYDVAIRELKKAYLLKRLPPLLLNIGATYRKMNDVDLSLHFYQKYLDEAPAGAKDRAEVEKIIGELKDQKNAPTEEPKNDEPAPSRDPKRGGGSEWNHNVIDAVPPETPIDVRVSTSVMKGVKVFVYYRGSGQADYNSVLMKRRGREKVGRIPGEAVTGRSLQYYIEAKDGAGTVVKSSGSQTNPNIIMVEEGVKPVMLASSSRRDQDQEQDTEEEDKPKKTKKPSRDLDEESAPTNGAVNLADDEPVRPRKAKSGGLTTLRIAGIGALAGGALLLGGGIGMLVVAKNDSEVLHDNSAGTYLDANNQPQRIYYNNDPGTDFQDSQRASRGKALNGAGIAFATIGSLGAAAGIGCLVADVLIKAQKAHPKKKHKNRRRVSEDDEGEETSNWYVAPSIGPTTASVSGGLSF